MKTASIIFLPFVLIIFAYGCCSATRGGQQIRDDNNLGSRAGHSLQRFKRSPPFHIIRDCMSVESQGGQYYVKGSNNVGEVCGIYFITDPDRTVQVHFDYMDVPCDDGGLVSFVDGWELNGQYFPSPADHEKPMTKRFHEFCGQRRVKQVFKASQNAAVVQYRIPARGRGFSVSVSFPKLAEPCNILIDGSDIYTIRNYWKHSNCTLSVMYPANIKLVSLRVGLNTGPYDLELEEGKVHKCHKRGLADYVQIGGSSGLDTTDLVVADSICGLETKSNSVEHNIFCGVSVVRLVSSGEFDNSVTVAVRQATEDDIAYATLICDL